MSPEEIKANDIKRLAAHLKSDLATSLELANQAYEFASKVEDFSVDEKNPYIYAVAVTLQHFYTSLETAFKRVVKEMEGNLPQGESWHRDLLEEVCLEIKGVRPELISIEIKKELDRIRRFRHVVRHGYEYDLDWIQISPLIKILEEIIPELKKNFKEFNSFLFELADKIEKDNRL